MVFINSGSAVGGRSGWAGSLSWRIRGRSEGRKILAFLMKELESSVAARGLVEGERGEALETARLVI